MTGIEAVVVFIALWAALFAGLYVLCRAWCALVLDPLWLRRERRRREREQRDRHVAELARIDNERDAALRRLRQAYTEASAEIRRQGRRG